MAQRKFFRIPDFVGGWNPDSSPNQIADNEAVDILNMRLDRRKGLISRQGYRRHITTDVAGSEITGLGQWGSSDNHIFVASNNNIYQANANTNLWELSHTGWSVNTSTNFINVLDELVAVNGTDTPVIFDGTGWRNIGIEAPPEITSYITFGGGTPLGQHSYKFTYFDADLGIESDTSEPLLLTWTATVSRPLFTIPNSSDPRVTHKRIYVQRPGSTSHQFLGEITNTAPSFFDDEVSTQPIVPLENGTQPLPLEHAAYHQGYLFGTREDKLYWSNPLQVESWNPLNSTTLLFEGGDDVTALVAHQDTLIVFGSRNTLLVSGSGGLWQLRRMDINLGAVNQYATIEVNGQLIFMSSQGLRMFPNFQPVSPRLDRYLLENHAAVLKNTRLHYLPEERALLVSVAGETFVISMHDGALSRYDLDVSYWLSDTKGHLLVLNQTSLMRYGGATDDGTSIPVMWKSKEFDFEPEVIKHFRRTGAYSTLGTAVSLTARIPSIDESYSDVLDAGAPTTPTWDSGTWDSSTWVNEGIGYNVIALPSRIHGQSLQIELNATVSNQVEIAPPISIEFRESMRFL